MVERRVSANCCPTLLGERAGKGDDTYDGAVDGEIDQLTFLHDVYHPLAGQTAEDE